MKNKRTFNVKKIILLSLIILSGVIISDGGKILAQQAQSAEATAPTAQEKQRLDEIKGSYTGVSGGSPTAKSTDDTNPAQGTQLTAKTWQQNSGEVAGLMGIVVSVAAKIMVWAASMIDFAVRLSSDVIKLDAVQSGWKIVLNLTNLGFVLAIIIIAFATIFRMESYAMKKTLWKLIVAALLVNFSLVIAGAVIDVGNTFTNVFLQASLGKDGQNLSNALGNALNPQRLGQVNDPSGGFSLYNPTTWISSFLQWIASYIFIIIFTFLMIIAFLTLFIMFLMRAIYFIILLVLSPIVWLLWIFPATSKYFKQWWTTFLRWNFFAPVVLFFIYLTVATAATLNSTSQFLDSAKQAGSSYNSAAAVLKKVTLAGPGGDFFNYSANLFVILGLLFGGIYAANKLGMEGGSVGMSIASWAGKGVGGWAGRKGIRAGTAIQRSKIGQRAIQGLQKYGATWGTTRWGKAGRVFLGPAIANRLGHGLEQVGVKRGESLVSQAEERQKKFSNDELAARLPTMTGDERVAALKKLAKSKDLDKVPNLADYIRNPKTEALFKSYGEGRSYSDMEKTAGFNRYMLTGGEKIKDRDGKEIELTREESSRKFQSTYSIKDYDKLQGDIFNTKKAYGLGADQERIRDAVRESMFDIHPGAISKTRSKLKGESLEDFQRALNEHIRKVEEKIIGQDIEIVKDMKVRVDGKVTTEEVKVKIPTNRASPKDKLKWVSENRPDQKDLVSRLYNSRNNLGGSLLGDYAFITGEGTAEAEPTTT